MDRRQELIESIQRKKLIQSIQMKQSAPKDPDQVNDQMPDWLATSDRAVVKNLANSPDEAIAYLAKKYPDGEFKASGDEIIARKRGEQAYGKLDPSFSPFSNPIGTLKDLGRDIADLGYDAVQAGSEAVGAAGGALAGGMAGAVTGSIPGAIMGMGAGGVAGAGAGAGAASTLKEALRAKLGLSDTIDGGAIARDALLGAALPVAFGAAGKGLKYGAQKVAPKLYAKATGIGADKLARIAQDGERLAHMGPDEALEVAEGVGTVLQKDLAGRKKAASAAYNAIDGETAVDVSSAAKLMEEKLAAIREKIARNPEKGAFKEELKELLELRKKYLSDNEGFTPIRMNVEDTLDLDSKLGDMLDYGDAGQGIGKGVSSAEEQLARSMRPELRGAVNRATGGAKAAADAEYVPLIDDANYIRSYFGNSKKTQSSLQNLGKGKDLTLEGGFKRLPKDVQEKLLASKQDLEIQGMFNGVNKNRVLTQSDIPELALGRTPLEKLLGAGGAAAGYVSGGPVMGVVGAGAGRGIAKLLTSPTSVLKITKAAQRLGVSAESLTRQLEQNPWMAQAILGGTAAGTIE